MINIPQNKHCADIMKCIHEVMESNNPYLAAYRHMAEIEKDEYIQVERET